MTEQMNESASEWIEWMNEWKTERKKEWMNEWMNEWNLVTTYFIKVLSTIVTFKNSIKI